MGLAWQAYGLGHLAKSVHGYYLVYRNFDNEMKTNRWFAKYETGSNRFGEQMSPIEFRGFDNLEEAQAFCEKNALDVERALPDADKSDGTVIFSLERALSGGTRLILELANKLGKPVLRIYDTRKERGSNDRTQIRFASRFKP